MAYNPNAYSAAALENILHAAHEITNLTPELGSLIARRKHLVQSPAVNDQLDDALVFVLTCAEQIRIHVQAFRNP